MKLFTSKTSIVPDMSDACSSRRWRTPTCAFRAKAAPVLPESPDGEQVAVVGVIEEKGAVEASDVFLSSKRKHSQVSQHV